MRNLGRCCGLEFTDKIFHLPDEHPEPHSLLKDGVLARAKTACRHSYQGINFGACTTLDLGAALNRKGGLGEDTSATCTRAVNAIQAWMVKWCEQRCPKTVWGMRGHGEKGEDGRVRFKEISPFSNECMMCACLYVNVCSDVLAPCRSSSCRYCSLSLSFSTFLCL